MLRRKRPRVIKPITSQPICCLRSWTTQTAAAVDYLCCIKKGISCVFVRLKMTTTTARRRRTQCTAFDFFPFRANGKQMSGSNLADSSSLLKKGMGKGKIFFQYKQKNGYYRIYIKNFCPVPSDIFSATLQGLAFACTARAFKVRN